MAATCTGFDHSDTATYTTQILMWWKMNQSKLPTWARAARMVFAMLSSSAPSERVFALVEAMFGEDQLSVLSGA